jgi:hypothetical protein
MSLTCFCTMSSSIFIVSLVRLKFSLADDVICTISSSICIVICCYCIFCCCVYPLCCALVNCICSKTCLASVSSWIILSLLFSSYSFSSFVQSCTFFATNSRLSSVMVYWGTSLWAFIFLCTPPDYKIVLLGGLDSIFFVAPFSKKSQVFFFFPTFPFL